MKAVVVELRDGKAAILDRSGMVSIIPDSSYRVGDVLDTSALSTVLSAEERTEEKPAPARILRAASLFVQRHQSAAAAVLISIGLLGAGGVAVAAPCSRVTLDVNPSVEYDLNVFDRVTSLKAFNDEGSEITEETGSGVRGKTIDTAMMMTLDSMRDLGYISTVDTDAIYTVESRFSKEDTLVTDVDVAVSSWNRSQDSEVSVKAVRIEVSDEVRKEAKERRLSPGKLALIRELESVSDSSDVNEDELLTKPVSEIRKAMDGSASPEGTGSGSQGEKENVSPAETGEKPTDEPKTEGPSSKDGKTSEPSSGEQNTAPAEKDNNKRSDTGSHGSANETPASTGNQSAAPASPQQGSGQGTGGTAGGSENGSGNAPETSAGSGAGPAPSGSQSGSGSTSPEAPQAAPGGSQTPSPEVTPAQPPAETPAQPPAENPGNGGFPESGGQSGENPEALSESGASDQGQPSGQGGEPPQGVPPEGNSGSPGDPGGPGNPPR